MRKKLYVTAVHPFIDGNGRTGRALIHLVLRRRGSAANFVPPISLVMATRSKSYIQGLSAFRAVDSEVGDGGREGVNEWVSFFAGACLTACEEAAAFEERAAASALVAGEAWAGAEELGA